MGKNPSRGDVGRKGTRTRAVGVISLPSSMRAVTLVPLLIDSCSWFKVKKKEGKDTCMCLKQRETEGAETQERSQISGREGERSA